MCDEIKEEKKNSSNSSNEKKVTCKTQNLYVLLVFFLIAIALLVAVSVYCYPIKY